MAPRPYSPAEGVLAPRLRGPGPQAGGPGLQSVGGAAHTGAPPGEVEGSWSCDCLVWWYHVLCGVGGRNTHHGPSCRGSQASAGGVRGPRCGWPGLPSFTWSSMLSWRSCRMEGEGFTAGPILLGPHDTRVAAQGRALLLEERPEREKDRTLYDPPRTDSYTLSRFLFSINPGN